MDYSIKIPVKIETIDFVRNNRKGWTREQLIALGRNPLVLPLESDTKWRFDYMAGLRKAGYIKKVNRKVLAVYYLYVAVFMVDTHLGWQFPGVSYQGMFLNSAQINKAYDELENEGADEAYQNMIEIIDAYLPENQAEVIKTRYGFKDGKFYRSYKRLSKNMPECYQFGETNLKRLEKLGLNKLKKVLPEPKV
ncbi:hypothetical protein IKW73_00545 [Candidatus Saccharibacteria bacterium]|nr:hypothetical protein [Candidatus Saccharibacteria bacterium]